MQKAHMYTKQSQIISFEITVNFHCFYVNVPVIYVFVLRPSPNMYSQFFKILLPFLGGKKNKSFSCRSL